MYTVYEQSQRNNINTDGECYGTYETLEAAQADAAKIDGIICDVRDDGTEIEIEQ